MFALRDIIVALVVFGGLPFIIRQPYIGILMWSWLSYMNPHKLSWGFARDFPFAQLVAIVTLVAMLNPTVKKRIPWTRESVLLIVFTAWMFITTLFCFYPELAWAQWDKVWKIQLFTFVTMILIDDKRKLELLLWVIVVSIGFYGVKGGIFTLTTGGGNAVYGPDGTFIGGNNEIGLALIMVVPWMRYFQLMADAVWKKHLMSFAILTTTFAIFGTHSRGALVGGAVMYTLLFVKNLRKIFFLILAGLTVFLAIQFMPEKWHARMGTIQTYEMDRSAMGRINAWWMAYNLALDNPVTGGGFHTFQWPSFIKYAPEPNRVHDAHSIYFEILGEQGFAGLGMFLLLGIFALRSSRQIMRQTKNVDHLRWMYHLGSMMQVSLIGYAATGAFLGLAYFDLYYCLIAIVVITRDLLRKELEVSTENAAIAAPTPRGTKLAATRLNRPPPAPRAIEYR